MNQSMNQRDMFFKWLYYAGAVLLLVLVQSLVLNRISVWAVHPFLPPVIAGIMAMLEGPAERLLSQGFLCAVLCAALALVITDLLHTVLLTFRQGVELSAALSLTGRELAVTVVLSPLVYLLLRSVHNRILR